jgi:hypothetical protein
MKLAMNAIYSSEKAAGNELGHAHDDVKTGSLQHHIFHETSDVHYSGNMYISDRGKLFVYSGSGTNGPFADLDVSNACCFTEAGVDANDIGTVEATIYSLKCFV